VLHLRVSDTFGMICFEVVGLSEPAVLQVAILVGCYTRIDIGGMWKAGEFFLWKIRCLGHFLIACHFPVL
jgi:hypothetical protein